MNLKRIMAKLSVSPVVLLLPILAALPLSSAAEIVKVEVDEIQYEINTETKEATCIGPENKSTFTRRNLALPESVMLDGIAYPLTSIGNEAFSQCMGLNGSLSIPNSVMSVGNKAFEFCRYFSGTLTLSNSLIAIGDNAFIYCNGFTGPLIIPNSVTSIGDNAFKSCSGFNGTLTLSNSLIEIGYQAFDNCSGFTGPLTIPNSVTTIGTWAFDDCTGFTGTLTISNSLKCIESWAFDNCKGLTSVIIPANVLEINYGAFKDCTGLKEVYYEAEDPIDASSSAFSDETYSNATLYVPEAAVEKCRTIDPWRRFATITPSAGINDVEIDSINMPASVYNLQGVRLKRDATQADIDALPAGIYIIGGKKVYVK
ncbi:MAG: leucine-rich repeat domain-containing protein [Muribaculaceae bacterium]|nr:leucine-rich repeat domain-containing protein [Muribaculaceae bacterium]